MGRLNRASGIHLLFFHIKQTELGQQNHILFVLLGSLNRANGIPSHNGPIGKAEQAQRHPISFSERIAQGVRLPAC
jgi:hypothetical protein